MVDCLEFVKMMRQEGGSFTVTLKGSLNIIRMGNNNGHDFNILGGSMNPKKSLLILALIFIAAGSFDFADRQWLSRISLAI